MSEINFDEWQAEIDKLRATRKKSELTEKEIEIIRYARNENNKVSWVNLAKYLNKTTPDKWSKSVLRERWIEHENANSNTEI